ncbi:MAG: UbiX family flavin prenyltransferase [Methanobacteriota archaeon]|nr:MAG: UbiX family flavin prenyltransferase [Euryarchaeota archaeon]
MSSCLDTCQDSDKSRIRWYLYINAPPGGRARGVVHRLVCSVQSKSFTYLSISTTVHVVVGITGASGLRYGVRLLECLRCERTVIMSADAARLVVGETGLSKEDIESKATSRLDNDDMRAPLASGSAAFDAMVVVPCSMSTLSKVACGIGDNLITRAASVALKERRRLVLVPRETPLSAIHLENMWRLSSAGAVVMPACPAFYPSPESVDDMVDFVVGRVLDQLGLEHSLYRRWSGDYPTRSQV